jgi:hypothetical protein
LLAFLALSAKPVLAQEESRVLSSGVEAPVEWEPLGAPPVDQAGGGRRGYVMAAEGTDVAEAGTDEISFHAVAANNFYREQAADLQISQRHETHTLAVGYRRGFKVGRFPLIELGGQIQLNERDNGFLNGFISKFETLWVSLTGIQSAKNHLREEAESPLALGTFVVKDGRSMYSAAGRSSGFGDFAIVVKALLREGAPSSRAGRVAARVALNVSGKSEFTAGNFVGIGASLERKLVNRAAFHGDVRATVALDRLSHLNLPLKRVSLGFSAGPELKLASNTSLSLQLDGSTTPYLRTGAGAFDNNYGSVTMGLGHRFSLGRRRLTAHLYARENMNLPFRIRWNIDPDLSLGFKITIRPTTP